jgi:alpha-glucosidase
MGDDIAVRNIEECKRDPSSLLHLYRRLLQLRREEPALIGGGYRPLRSRHDILMYQRMLAERTLLVALNTAHEPRKLVWEGQGTLLISTCLERQGAQLQGPLLLGPDEGIVLKLGT